MLNVLIADDSNMIRRNLKKILEEAGHKVIAEAGDGKFAYHAYKKHLPDLVTMDITMPGMDGITSVKHIVKEYPNAKIIMVTAHGQEEMVFEAIQSGASGYILKPLDKEKILEIIEKVFDIKHSEEMKKADDDNEITTFYIENLGGTFIARIKTKNESLEKDIMGEIRRYIKNLFIIKPLNLIFDFGDIKLFNGEAVHEFFKLVKEINELDSIVKIHLPRPELQEVFKETYKNHKGAKAKIITKINA